MTNIEPDDFRLLGQKILGRTIGVIFLGQWNESQVYEAFEKYMILVPKGLSVRIRTYWVIKDNQPFMDGQHPLDNQLKECRMGEQGSFQITIAKFISPQDVKRLENEKRNKPSDNQKRSADPREGADGKGNEAGGKNPPGEEQDLPF